MLEELEAANTLIVEHKIPWCRARLLHALAAAEEQGTLEEVLDELLSDGYSAEQQGPIRKTIRTSLMKNGWIARAARKK